SITTSSSRRRSARPTSASARHSGPGARAHFSSRRASASEDGLWALASGLSAGLFGTMSPEPGLMSHKASDPGGRRFDPVPGARDMPRLHDLFHSIAQSPRHG